MLFSIVATLAVLPCTFSTFSGTVPFSGSSIQQDLDVGVNLMGTQQVK